MSDFGERLTKLGKVLGKEEQELGRIGGVTKDTFSKYKNGLAYPRFEALQRWIKELGLNANWLIMGEGPMFMKDFDAEQSSPPPLDPITQRILTLERVLRDASATDEDIIQAVKAAVRADASMGKDRSCDAGGTSPVAKKLGASHFNDL